MVSLVVETLQYSPNIILHKQLWMFKKSADNASIVTSEVQTVIDAH